VAGAAEAEALREGSGGKTVTTKKKKIPKKPSPVTLDRIYRRVAAIEKSLGGGASVVGRPSLSFLRDIGWGARKDITELRCELRETLEAICKRIDSFAVLANHCERLLREKETLQKRVTALEAEPQKYVMRGRKGQLVPAEEAMDEVKATQHVNTNKYIAAPLRSPTLHPEVDAVQNEDGSITMQWTPKFPLVCGMQQVHVKGIKCLVCGETPT